MSDEDYATAWKNHHFYLHELEVYREFEYIRKDFQFIVSCFSELYGEELFNYLRVNQDNHELRKCFVLTLENGDCVFDCSLREPFNSRLIIEKIKKRWSELEVSARNFASHFARKAFNDLAEYDFVKAKHADHLQDLLDRPYEDILAMEVEDQPAPAPAPASEVKQEEEDAPMEVDESSAAKKPRVSSDADVPMEGSSLEEVSSGQPGSSSKPPKAEGSPMGEGSTRRPKPSTRQPKVEGSSLEDLLHRRRWSLQQRRLRKRFGKEFGATQPLRCCPMLLSCWKRTPRLILVRDGWILSQRMKSLLTRRRTLVSRSSSGRAESSVSTEKKNSIRNFARLSGSSASKSMEVRAVDSITIIAAMTP